jgi:MFS family permease
MSLSYRYSSHSDLGLAVAKGDVVRMATAQAAAKGVNATDWRKLVDLKPNNELRHYLAVSATPAERVAIERVISHVLYRCALENPANSADSILVTVSPKGRPISYHVPPSADPNRAQVSEAQARQAAEQELSARLGADREGFALTGSGVQRHESTSSDIRRFTFRKPYGKDIAIEAVVETSGAKVIGFTLTPRISPAREKRFPELGMALKTVRGVAILLFVLAALVYVIARFVRRLREQEIPLKRTIIVAALVFISFGASILLNSESQRIDALQVGAAPGPAVNLVLSLVVATIMATILGITWGACEADLREAYPEKLTSTDALLSGVVSSRAVRSSLAIGLALAGWATFFSGLEQFLRVSIGGWASIADGELTLFQTAWPALVVVLYAFAGLPVLMGMLLAAVSATHRKGRTRNTQIAMASIVFIVILLGSLGNYRPIAWSIVSTALTAAVLLVPFLAGDVLTVIIVTAVSTWATFSASLIAQPAVAFQTAGWKLIAVAIVGAGVIVALRKRETIAEVARPEYARNIAERLLLKTEMDAARAAQLRVMPRVVPTIDGVKLAARYSASAEIGSDYHELFASPGHVSVAVADARLPGLSSALCVSMLKGLLLNYAARLTSPRDVADRVYRQLSAIFGDDLPVSFFFGRLDRATGAFAFATFGDAPHAVLVRAGNATSLDGEEFVELAPIDHRESSPLRKGDEPVELAPIENRVSSPLRRGEKVAKPDEGSPSWQNEGIASTAPVAQAPSPDAIVIYTAHLAELRDRDGAALGDEALHTELAAQNSAEPQRLVDAIFELAARRARGVDEPQSWTAVALAWTAEGMKP